MSNSDPTVSVEKGCQHFQRNGYTYSTKCLSDFWVFILVMLPAGNFDKHIEDCESMIYFNLGQKLQRSRAVVIQELIIAEWDRISKTNVRDQPYRSEGHELGDNGVTYMLLSQTLLSILTNVGTAAVLQSILAPLQIQFN